MKKKYIDLLFTKNYKQKHWNVIAKKTLLKQRILRDSLKLE